MIVSCPSCSARYKIDATKIKGRGAKITCPRCGHKFVVYKDADDAPPASDAPAAAPEDDITTRDFSQHGVVWKVRKGIGLTYDFSDLRALQEYMADGQVDGRDSLSYDGRTWVPIDSIDDLPAYFREAWKKAERGEIASADQFVVGDEDEESDDEDESDAPTTIMRHGSSLMDDIRRAVQDATTPGPAEPRALPPPVADPGRTPGPVGGTPGRPSYLAESEVDEPSEHTAPPLRSSGSPAEPDPFSKLGGKDSKADDEGGGGFAMIVTLVLVVVVLAIFGTAAAVFAGYIEIPGLNDAPDTEAPPAGETPATKPTPEPADEEPPVDEGAASDALGAPPEEAESEPPAEPTPSPAPVRRPDAIRVTPPTRTPGAAAPPAAPPPKPAATPEPAPSEPTPTPAPDPAPDDPPATPAPAPAAAPPEGGDSSEGGGP